MSAIEVSALINGNWTEVTPFYRGEGGQSITINRGRTEESGLVAGKAEMALKNLDGALSPWNPLGPYYGHLKRNTPLRISIASEAVTGRYANASDTFTRTVASGWSNAEVGGAWTGITSGTTTSSVNGTQGVHYIAAAPSYRFQYLDNIDAYDVTQAITFTVPTPTGAVLEPANLLFRGTTISSYVMVRVSISNTDSSVRLLAFAADNTQLVNVLVNGLTHTNNTPLRVKARVVGQDIFAKVWNPAGAEPDDWQMHTVDPARPVSGWIGIRSGRATGNTNTVDPQFVYDNYSATVSIPLFYGEVPAWGVTWGQAEVYFATMIEPQGILRRILQGKKVLASAAYRAIAGALGATFVPLVNVAPIAYWPMEDQPSAQFADSAVTIVPPLTGGGPSTYTDPTTGVKLPVPSLPKFGASEATFGSDKVIDLQQGGILSGAIPLQSSATNWEMHFIIQITPEAFGTSIDPIPALLSMTTEGTVDTLNIGFSATFLNITTSIGLKSFGPITLDDGAPHHVAMFAFTDAGNTIIGVLIDNVPLSAVFDDTFTGTTGQPRSIIVNPTRAVDNRLPKAFGHLAIWSPFLSAEQTGLIVTAVHGHLGELATDRMVRVSAEDKIPFALNGTPTTSIEMGAQRSKAYIDTIIECVNTDGGVLYEPATWLAIEYRPREALMNQPTAVTFDYAGNMLVAVPSLIADDYLTKNKVTATVEHLGASYTTTIETGTLSVEDPLDGGVGVYDTQIPCNPYDVATGTVRVAEWAAYRGTYDGPRITGIATALEKAPYLANQTLYDAVISLDVDGSPVALTNLPARAIAENFDNRVLVIASTTMLDQFEHNMTFATIPEGPWEAAIWDDATYTTRYDTDLSSTSADYNAGTHTTITVVTAQSGHVWLVGNTGPDFPIECTIGGLADVNVTAISGATSPQTFTVSAATLNGFTGVIPSGASVRLRRPRYWTH